MLQRAEMVVMVQGCLWYGQNSKIFGLQVHLEHLPALVPGLKVLLLHLPALVPGLSWSLRGVRPKIFNIFENIQNIL